MIATASVIEWDDGVITPARLPSRCTWMRSATSKTCVREHKGWCGGWSSMGSVPTGGT
jgi:hypothetical protein